MALDPKWDDPIFVDSLPPELRAAYDAETRKLAEQWEREIEEDLIVPYEELDRRLDEQSQAEPPTSPA